MIPVSLSFYIAKVLQVIIKRFGRGGGTALPGLIAYRLNKKILPVLAQQLGGTIVVSGTNGKTTTSRLLASLLEGHKQRIVHNRSGSNLTRGLASTLIAQAGWNRKITADWGIFEVDEAVFAEVVTLLQPKYVVATNLFRDQLDRYGEISTLADKWRIVCQQLSPNTKLVLNADDPLVASLGLDTPAQVITFGIQQSKAAKDTVKLSTYADSRHCPLCGAALVFSQIHYSHIGKYTCPNGDFNRPEPEVAITKYALKGMSGSTFTVAYNQDSIDFNLNLAGLYNLYNVMAALTVGLDMGISHNVLQARVKSFEAVFGRQEIVKIGQTNLVLILVKNPTGFNQVIQTLNTEPDAQSFWILLNDRIADGRDISWIWDVELEKLHSQAQQLIVGGTRAYDMALRAKYAGFDASKVHIHPSLAEGLRAISALKQDEVYCLCTYTAMMALRQQLQKNYTMGANH